MVVRQFMLPKDSRKSIVSLLSLSTKTLMQCYQMNMNIIHFATALLY